MANPVMNSIVKDWSTQQTTPAGYPAMPGYQPASQQAPNPYGGSTNPYAQGGVGDAAARSTEPGGPRGPRRAEAGDEGLRASGAHRLGGRGADSLAVVPAARVAATRQVSVEGPSPEGIRTAR